MPLDRDQINQKLAQLEEYLRQIKELQVQPESEFNEKSMVEAAAERDVYKACQQVIDIAQTISADLGFGPPRFYRDLFTQLGQKKVISPELQVKLERMTGLRNILAHEYAQVNPEEIYRIVMCDYDDLVEFSQAVIKYLKKLN